MNYFKNIYTLILVFMSITAPAQWTHVGPWGGSVIGIASNNSGLYALTPYTIYKSTNNGNSWNGTSITVDVYNNAISPTSSGDVFKVNNSVMLYASGYEIYISTNNGITWTVNYLFGKTITGITFKGNDIYASTAPEYSPLIYKSSNNGNVWDVVSTDLPNIRINDLTAFGGYLLVASDSGIYKSNSNGSNWFKCLNGYANEFGISLNTIFASFVYDSIPLYKSTNGGFTWVKADKGITSRWIQKIHTKDNYIYISTLDSGIFKSSNNGNDWHKFNNGTSGNEGVYNFANVNEYVFIGPLYFDDICSSLPNDTYWTKKVSGYSTINFKSFARSGSFLYAGGYTGLYYSTNGGSTWEKSHYFQSLGRYSTVQCLYNVDNHTPEVLFAVVDTSLFRSTNNGLNWQQLSVPLSNSGSIISLYYTNNILFAGCANGYPPVLKSTDLGLTWQVSGTGIQNPFAHCFLNYNGHLFTGTGGGVYYSSNMGNSWVPRNNGFQGLLVFPSILSVNDRILVTKYDGIYYSTNLGLHWAHLSGSEEDIYFINKNGDFLYGTGYDAVYMSTNSGYNWILKNQGLYTRGKSLIYFDNDYAFLVMESGGIWRRAVNNLISIRKISTDIPSDYSLMQNYPNPFNPSTKITFSIPLWRGTGGRNIVTLKVYDITGREVQTLVNEELQSGTYDVTFDGTGLNSGVYFYQLTAGCYRETRRMILIK